MAISRKAAPKQEVLEIERVGEWGKVTYRHRLVCGHTDVRKRPAPASHIACMMCLYERERPTPALPQVVAPLGDADFDVFDAYAGSEQNAARVQAGIATRFGVSNDAVDVVTDAFGRISYVLVFLDAATAERLA